jgi:hypothetical protein
MYTVCIGRSKVELTNSAINNELNQPINHNCIFYLDVSQQLEKNPILDENTILHLKESIFDLSPKNIMSSDGTAIYASKSDGSVPTSSSLLKFEMGDGQAPNINYLHPGTTQVTGQARYTTETVIGSRRVQTFISELNIPILTSIFRGACQQYYPAESRTTMGNCISNTY